MANSLESRLPFMDYRLVEYSFTLPYWMKMKNGLGKYIHRVALENIVPDYILKNPLKFGFNTPISEFFKDNSVGSPVNILLSEQCLQREIFDREKLLKLIKTHQSGKRNHSRLLFRLYQVELWFRTFID
jgi:asparagine synthase (glutamine-hydrolysing)